MAYMKCQSSFKFIFISRVTSNKLIGLSDFRMRAFYFCALKLSKNIIFFTVSKKKKTNKSTNIINNYLL